MAPYLLIDQLIGVKTHTHTHYARDRSTCHLIIGTVGVKLYHSTKRTLPWLQKLLINVLCCVGIFFYPICSVVTLDTDIPYILWLDSNTFPPPSGVLQITKYLH